MTARYKAKLTERYCKGGVLADLTGGLGVDSWAFSKVASCVCYNEMNTALADAVKHNHAILGCDNIHYSSFEINPQTFSEFVALLPSKPDMIFIDPARRDGAGKKVFLLEDCSPDVTHLLPSFFEVCDTVMMKLSPMADISMLAGRLNPYLSEVHVVGSKGECKELLCVLGKNHEGGYRVIVSDLSSDGGPFSFAPEEEAAARPVLAEKPESLLGMTLIDPGATWHKAGCFNLLCERKGLVKIGFSTHLYASREGNRPIVEVLPFNNASMKTLAESYRRCELTARNLPITSDQLRKKMKVTSGGDVHIYALTCNFTSAPEERLFLVVRNSTQ